MCLDPFSFFSTRVMSPSPGWLTTERTTSSSLMHFLHLTKGFNLKDSGETPGYLTKNSERTFGFLHLL